MLSFLIWTALAGGTLLVAAHQLSPERRACRRLASALRKALMPWTHLVAWRREIEARLKKRAKAYVRHWRELARETADIDELRAYADARGLRLAALREGGYGKVGMLARSGPSAWLRVPGVGSQTARAIAEALGGFEQNLARRRAALPGNELRDRVEVKLVEAARELLDWMEHVAPHEAGGRALEGRVREVLERARGQSGFWAWLNPFRTAATRAARAIPGPEDVLSSDDLEQLRLIGRAAEDLHAIRRRIVTVEMLRTDYERRRSDYVALLEGYLGGARNDDARDYLPPEVLDLIEALSLVLDGLKVSLRGYQHFGARFMVVQRRTLVGDEMGLGKTIQALAAMTHLRNEEGARHFMVACPSSIVDNWAREIRNRSDLRVCVLKGTDRHMATADWIGSGGVGLTSFETLRSGDILAAMRRHGIRVAMAIGDEAHYVKNPDALRTRAFSELSEMSTRVCLMTGTPIENRLSEFRNIVSHFSPEYARKLGVCALPDAAARIRKAEFMQIVAPIYLRRNQVDVLTELPEKIEKDEWVELSASDREAYTHAVRSRNFMAMRRTATIGANGQGSAKLERLEELASEYRAEGRKLLVFSYFLDVMRAVERRFSEAIVINGSVPQARRVELMDRFREARGFQVLVCQIGVGGIGLNLQAASVVIILEPQWKPSTESQAIARAHRMGQTRSVMVHRLLAEDCVDERMVEILSTKQALFDTYARDSALKEGTSEATERRMMDDIIEAELARIGA